MVSLIKPEREGMWPTFEFEKDVPMSIHLCLDTTGCSAVARSFERRTVPGGENGVGGDPIQRWSQRLCQVEAFEVNVMWIDNSLRAGAILDIAASSAHPSSDARYPCALGRWEHRLPPATGTG